MFSKRFSTVFLVTVFAFSLLSCKSGSKITENNDVVFRIPEVDKVPMLGGKDPVQGFNEHVRQNIQYPTEAAKNGISGNVIVSFII